MFNLRVSKHQYDKIWRAVNATLLHCVTHYFYKFLGKRKHF